MYAAGSPPLQPTRAARLLLDGVKIEPCTIIIMVSPFKNKSLLFAYRRRRKLRGPDKKDISSPCGFEHLVSIGSEDYTKYFSLQTFVQSKNFPPTAAVPTTSNNTTTTNVVKTPSSSYGKSKWAPQPPKSRLSES
jgi:hypothetical protein